MSDLDDLRAEVAALRATVEELRGAAAAPGATPDGPVTRRTAFKALGAAAVGAAAGSIAFAAPGGAVDGGNVVIGSDTQTAESPTVLRVANGTTWSNPAGQFGGFGVTDVATADLFSADVDISAVFGWADGSAFRTGIRGYAAPPTADPTNEYYGGQFYGENFGIAASGGEYGLSAIGPKGSIKLFPQLTSLDQTVGERGAFWFQEDDRNLWFCVDSLGTNRWRRLTGTDAAGAFTAITPVRVYDSRWSPSSGVTVGALGGGSREISVANGRDGTTGAVDAPNAVPAGARAIAFNLTITSTVAAGFLNVTPGGTSSASSTINWDGNGITVANAAIVALSTTRTIRVTAGGEGTTQFLIDVAGYWL